jgi:hypothetical protein
MRRFTLGLFAFLTTAAVSLGQNPQSLGMVTAESVVVRGTPRSDATDLGTLPRGTTVVIHHVEGVEWLAIQPPRGSVGWVNHKFIRPLTPGAEKFPQDWVVNSLTDVKLAVGKQGDNRPLDIRMTAVPDGTLVTVIGPKVENPDDNSKWYPIIPPEDDFRYVPKSAVRVDGVARTGFVVRSTEMKPTTTTTEPVTPTPTRTVVGSSNPTWLQAQQAEQVGEFDRAEKLYFQLAREMNGPNGDTDLANQCYARVHTLREKRRTGERTPAVLTSRTDTPKPQPARDEQTLSKWSGPGTLRATGFRVDGRPAFALENAKQQIIVYAVAGSGIDLSRHERRKVDLYGTSIDLPELRGVKLIKVTEVDQVR